MSIAKKLVPLAVALAAGGALAMSPAQASAAEHPSKSQVTEAVVIGGGGGRVVVRGPGTVVVNRGFGFNRFNRFNRFGFGAPFYGGFYGAYPYYGGYGYGFPYAYSGFGYPGFGGGWGGW